MLEIPDVEWGVVTVVALDGAYVITVQRDISEESLPLFQMMPVSCRDPCPPYDPRPEGNDFIDYYLSRFLHDKMVVIEQGYDRIGSFLNADNLVRIYKKLLFVHAG
jgi:hypothetical protein